MSELNPRKMAVGAAATWIGVDPRTLQNWRKEGAPWNDDGTVSVPDLVQWRIRRAAEAAEATTLKEAQTQKTLIEAELKRLELKLRAGEVIEFTDVVQEVTYYDRLVRDRVLAMPAAIASKFPRKIGKQILEIGTREAEEALLPLNQERCRKRTTDTKEPMPRSRKPAGVSGKRVNGR